jgi:hydroxymethylglutaryl-CoA reductase
MTSEKSSLISHFYKKTHKQRLSILKDFARLSKEEISFLENITTFDFDSANRMIENVVSIMPLPLGIATNFLINNKNYLIPMALEEPSVVAAASSAAKLARTSGGFESYSTAPIMIGQIQLTNIQDFNFAKKEIEANKQKLIELSNQQDHVLMDVGGGAQDLQTKIIQTSRGKMLIIHLLVNVKDAMGANIINTMAEKIAPTLEKITRGHVGLRIVSNLPIHRITTAKAIWKKELIGEHIIEEILNACAFAHADPYRCTTHNKGIMNGIDAVTIATGNDFRAIEAGVHAFASMEKEYKPLTKYYKNKNGDLVGKIKIPLTVGIVGGITQTHPTAKICLKILDVKSSCELANVIASVGLAQNFAALKALVKDGIQKSHMKLHSKNIAIASGATKETIDFIAQRMIEEDNISVCHAKELIKIYAQN